MPIRLNLLAEEQAAEEMRRRDPVKRAAWIGLFLVILILVWSSSLQLKLILDNGKLTQAEAKFSDKTNEVNKVIKNQKQLADANEKLAALNKLAANRFLHADVLDLLEHTTVDGVQLTRVRCEQSFTVVQEEKAKKVDGKIILGKPGSSTEKIVLTLEARDTSPNPGNDRITKYKEGLVQYPYFRKLNISTNEVLLKNRNSPQVDNETGGSFVLFSLECRYPDRVR